jgi:hypothetical protein
LSEFGFCELISTQTKAKKKNRSTQTGHRPNEFAVWRFSTFTIDMQPPHCKRAIPLAMALTTFVRPCPRRTQEEKNAPKPWSRLTAKELGMGKGDKGKIRAWAK